ncbi:MAG: hypothetical protein ACXVGN_05150 [Mycobacteriaceae bacterium]
MSDDEKVGSVGEEAAKLLHALQEWAKESGSEHAGAASSAAGAFKEVNEHIATGADECRYCPLCQAISVVRNTSPEVKAHLSTAATSFVQAVVGLMAPHVPDEKDRGGSGVERIDLDDDGEWEDD